MSIFKSTELVDKKLNEPEEIELDRLLTDTLLSLQASFNAHMVDKYNTKQEKDAIKLVINMIDKKIEGINPLFFETGKD